MRKITKFPKLVINEAKNLKKYATTEEIASLGIVFLNAKSRTNCIYGQMTGNCNSKRAIELIKKCALRVYNKNESGWENCKLNGSPTKKEGGRGLNIEWFSPIELFIGKAQRDNRHDMNNKLIAFLKGERKRLI